MWKLAFGSKILVHTASYFPYGSKHTAVSERPQFLLFSPTLMFSLNFNLAWVFCSESIGKFGKKTKYILAQVPHEQLAPISQLAAQVAWL